MKLGGTPWTHSMPSRAEICPGNEESAGKLLRTARRIRTRGCDARSRRRHGRRPTDELSGRPAGRVASSVAFIPPHPTLPASWGRWRINCISPPPVVGDGRLPDGGRAAPTLSLAPLQPWPPPLRATPATSADGHAAARLARAAGARQVSPDDWGIQGPQNMAMDYRAWVMRLCQGPEGVGPHEGRRMTGHRELTGQYSRWKVLMAIMARLHQRSALDYGRSSDPEERFPSASMDLAGSGESSLASTSARGRSPHSRSAGSSAQDELASCAGAGTAAPQLSSSDRPSTTNPHAS